MAFCAFARDGAMFGSTPVENMFILEYMPAAPGDFVRVYLYGLMLCHHPEMNEDMEGMARTLRIEPDAVEKAYQYWEREGLVTKLSDNPPTYEYAGMRESLMNRTEPMDDVYRYRTFNQELQLALPEMMLDHHEIRLANEWLDELHLPADVILFMVKQEVNRRGKKLPAPRTLFKHLDDTAKEWAKEKLVTVEAAEEYVRRGSLAAGCAAAVIDRLNWSRRATKDEIELAEKWIGEWGFSREEVLAACGNMPKTGTPSFGYLDGILASRREDGGKDETHEAVKKLLKHLGVMSVPTPAQIKRYREFLEMGFDFGAVEQAAIWCGANNRRTFDDIARKLEQWRKMHVFTLAEIEEERRIQKQYEDIVQSIFERCELDKRISQSDIAQAKIWTALIELDTVLFAAECAKGAEAPMKYINKLVSAWSAKGIRTVEAAQKEFIQHRAQTDKPTGTAQTPAYAQREVTEEEFETGFYVDVMSRGKADKA